MGCVFGHQNCLSKNQPVDIDSHPRMFRVINVDSEGHTVVEGILEVGDQELTLHEPNSHSTQWPLRSLRRYGCDREMFSFECGRRCPTGQGIYAFKSERAEELFNMLQDRVHQAGNEMELTGRMTLAGQTVHVVSPHMPPTPNSPGVWSLGLPIQNRVNADTNIRFSPSSGGNGVITNNSSSIQYRSNVRNLTVFPNMSSVAQRVQHNPAPITNSPSDYMQPVSTGSNSVNTSTNLVNHVPESLAVPAPSLQYADLDLDKPFKNDLHNHTDHQVLSPSHVAYQNIEVTYGDGDVFRDSSNLRDPPFYVNTDLSLYPNLPMPPHPPMLSGHTTQSNGTGSNGRVTFLKPISNGDRVTDRVDQASASDDTGPTKGYSIIDFAKTAAINAKTNTADDESSRKTRHDSNIEDLQLN